MTPEALIQLSARKNAAHKDFLRARSALRPTGGSEQDRNVHMDSLSREQREAWENLSDEYAIRFAEKFGVIEVA